MSGGPSQHIQPLVRCKHCGRHIGLGGTGTHLSSHRNKGIDILEPMAANYEPIDPTETDQPTLPAEGFGEVPFASLVKTDKEGRSEPVVCTVCGGTYKASGMGRHLAACLKNAGKSKPEAFDRSAPVECKVCGKTLKASGFGRHMAAHRTNGKARVPAPTTAVVRTVVDTKPLNGHTNGNLSSIEVAMAVLSRLSPDGRIAVADMPEVLEWIQHTDRVVRLVGGY